MLSQDDKIEIKNIVEDVITKVVEDLIKPSFELVYQKFEQIDKRFDRMEARQDKTDERLDRVEAKLETMDGKLDMIVDQASVHDKTLIEHEERITQLEKTALPD